MSSQAIGPPPVNPPTATLTGITVAPNAADGVKASVGAPVQFTATGSYSDGSSADLTGAVVWASSDESAATISNAAGSAGVLSPVGAGTTQVSATHSDSGLSASVTVNVVPAELAPLGLDIVPVDPTILFGTSLQFEATGTLTDDSQFDYTQNVIWSSSDEAVATISQTGLATALSCASYPCSTTITATDPVTGQSDTTLLTVTDVPAVLSYVRLSRGSVIGGSANQVTGTVVLTSYATEPVTIFLWTSYWAKKGAIPTDPTPYAAVPESVVVPTGSSSATFDVTHYAVGHRTRVGVYASDGTYAKRASLWLRVQR